MEMEEFEYEYEKPKKKIFVIICFLLIIGLIFAGYNYFNYKSDIETKNLETIKTQIEEQTREPIIIVDVKTPDPNIKNPLTSVNPRHSFQNSSGNEMAYIDHTGNYGAVGNITINTTRSGYGFFQYLGSSSVKILKGFFIDLQVDNSVNASQINATTAFYEGGNRLALNTSLSDYLLTSQWNATNISYMTWAQIINGTMASWANVMNGTLMSQATYNTNYSTLMLQSTFNTNYSANDPIYRSFANNYSTFLTHITWANVVNGTMASWANVMNGTVMQSSGGNFTGNINMSTGNNITFQTSTMSIYSNTTCIILNGSTSTLKIC